MRLETKKGHYSLANSEVSSLLFKHAAMLKYCMNSAIDISIFVCIFKKIYGHDNFASVEIYRNMCT